MAEKRFYSMLHHRKVPIETPVEIVQYSYIVQNSIYPLDLELSQSYYFQYYLGTEETGPLLKNVINTQEKCRNVLAERRKLLYTLHLDLPKKREWNLKSASQPENVWLDPRLLHISQVSVTDSFYLDILCKLIEYVCKFTRCQSRILKWFIKFYTFDDYKLPNYITNHFVKCMHPAHIDLEFMRECFKKLDFKNWMYDCKEPRMVALLLYQIHLSGSNLGLIIWSYYFTELCVLHPLFLYVGDILLYKDTLSLSDTLHRELIRRVEWPGRIWRTLTVRWTNRKRSTLLLHLFWVYFHMRENTSAASETLRLLWNSVPDAFFSFEEIESILRNVISDYQIVDMYAFYSEAVGEYNSLVQPRMLEHYCRTVIRRIIWIKNQWIPEGVMNSGLPAYIHPYLLLQN